MHGAGRPTPRNRGLAAKLRTRLSARVCVDSRATKSKNCEIRTPLPKGMFRCSPSRGPAQSHTRHSVAVWATWKLTMALTSSTFQHKNDKRKIERRKTKLQTRFAAKDPRRVDPQRGERTGCDKRGQLSSRAKSRRWWARRHGTGVNNPNHKQYNESSPKPTTMRQI